MTVLSKMKTNNKKHTKLKSFHTTKVIIHEMEKQPTEWEKLLGNNRSLNTYEYYAKYIKNSQPNRKNLIKK